MYLYLDLRVASRLRISILDLALVLDKMRTTLFSLSSVVRLYRRLDSILIVRWSIFRPDFNWGKICLNQKQRSSRDVNYAVLISLQKSETVGVASRSVESGSIYFSKHGSAPALRKMIGWQVV